MDTGVHKGIVFTSSIVNKLRIRDLMVELNVPTNEIVFSVKKMNLENAVDVAVCSCSNFASTLSSTGEREK